MIIYTTHGKGKRHIYLMQRMLSSGANKEPLLYILLRCCVIVRKMRGVSKWISASNKMQLRDACVITFCKQSHPAAREKKTQIATNKAAMR